MMATTSISSIRVKPDWDLEGFMTTGLLDFWEFQCRAIVTGNRVEFQISRNLFLRMSAVLAGFCKRCFSPLFNEGDWNAYWYVRILLQIAVICAAISRGLVIGSKIVSACDRLPKDVGKMDCHWKHSGSQVV